MSPATLSTAPLYAPVLALLATADIEGLIASGAPADEYDPEAGEIADRMAVGEHLSAADLAALWQRWFAITRPREEFTALAEDLGRLTA